MIKRFVSSCAIILLSAVSCRRQEMVSHGTTCHATVDISGCMSADYADRGAQNIRLSIYREGLFIADTVLTGSGTHRIMMEGVTSGYFDMLAVTEGVCHDDEGVVDLHTMGKGFSQEDADSWIAGAGRVYIDTERHNTISMELKHLLSKVTVKTICCNWERCTPQSFVVESIYIQNVPSSRNLWNTGEQGGMLNLWTEGNYSEDGKECGTVFTPEEVKNLAAAPFTMSAECSMYYFGNRAENYPQRLVIRGRISIAGITRTEYWPIDLPWGENGNLYEFENITICGEGAYTPNGSISTGDVAISLKIQDWNETDRFEYEN